MAAGAEYPANFEDDAQNVRLAGAVQFTDDTNQPLPLAGGDVTGDVDFTGSVVLGGAAETVGFYGDAGDVKQTVPLTTPDVQDVIDALVALGLITQSD